MSPPPAPSALIVGEGTLAIRCGEHLRERGWRLVGVATREPVIERWADGLGLRRGSSGSGLAAFAAGEPFDYLFSIVNLSVLPAEVIGRAGVLAVNFHDGPLPEYAGLNVTSWAIANRERCHAVTWHEMTSRVDAGRILKLQAVPIAADETAFSLNTRCYAAGMDSFAELALELTEDRLAPIEQDQTRRRYFGADRLPPAGATLSFDASAEEITALVRALDFGSYANPLAVPKLAVGAEVMLALTALELERASTSPPGTILALEAGTVAVATRTRDLRLGELRSRDGLPVDARDLMAGQGLGVGARLSPLESSRSAVLDARLRALRRHEAHWVGALRGFVPPELPFLSPRSGAGAPLTLEVGLEAAFTLPGATDVEPESAALAVILGFLARLTDRSTVVVGYVDAALVALVGGGEAYLAARVPLAVPLPSDAPLDLVAIDRAVGAIRERGTYALDLWVRRPELVNAPRQRGEPPYSVNVTVGVERAPPTDAPLSVSIAPGGRSCRLTFDPALVAPAAAAAVTHQLTAFLCSSSTRPGQALGQASLVGDEERQRLLALWDEAVGATPSEACLHDLFAAQARRTPDAVAVVFRSHRLSYRALDEQANRLAHHLVSLGVGPDVLVGVFMERSLDLLVAMLATLKAGGAYLPLDPEHPPDRVAFMLEDAAVSVVLVQGRTRARLPATRARMVTVDDGLPELAARPLEAPAVTVRPDHLCYVIYTSGSTGRPKGVMVEHRNVVSFGAGMDQHLGARPGVWLAVTGLGFDISVLELLWTLTRGYTVVLYAGGAAGTSTVAPVAARGIDLSLFYFSSDESDAGTEKYQLMIDGARFADQHGFAAVWTPERHFHPFGGLYPNPALTSAALATITQRISLRAGSCVSPLHHPLRVAEEWSLVDNLSHGRVGISFAAGWQPDDFILCPEAFADRKRLMFENIETVRRLWRGEAVPFPNGHGTSVAVRALPRPYQAELPVWVTAAGNPETFEAAARIGAGVLTHLLGQTVEELAAKVALYRRVWRESGQAGRGVVSLMLHTFVGSSDATVKEVVRRPMKAYLRSAVDLIRAAAWSFPTFKARTTTSGGGFSTDGLSPADFDALLDASFERYHGTSGLFGSVETCVGFLERMKAIDVDEVACLIDFGVPTAEVLASLPALAEVLTAANSRASTVMPLAATEGGARPDASLAELITAHGVTHLQCTPSLASMLVADPSSRAALGQLSHLLVGGEALPVALARELAAAVGGQVLNMYGPTETTIWSSTHRVAEAADPVPIGRPLANTALLILDAQRRLMPAGAPGELCIGGQGVSRGYLNRPELTEERFVKDPFRASGARLYRTGDLARLGPDGAYEFLGRLDQQVKIRGYRIEPGEIETRLAEHPDVRETVVVAREDVPGDVRLVAYFTPRDGRTPTARELREHLEPRLPEPMIPGFFVPLRALPLTPNRKVDRRALPPPGGVVAASVEPHAEPATALERTISEVWRTVLGLDAVGVEDNFVSLGGHSLLMVQVLTLLEPRVTVPVSLVDLFRCPTIRSLAAFLSATEPAPGTAGRGAARAGARRQALEARRART